jgi:phosphoribosyl 1,2-cyclic phosphodiesterase
MMRMTVLASGSKGNSTVIATERTRVLVDAGLSCRELLKRMSEANEDPGQLNAIVITHEHQDHVQGLAVLARKLNIPVFFTEATHRAWIRWMTPQRRVTYAEWLAARKAAEDAPAGEAAAAEKAEEMCEPVKDPAELTRLPAVEYFRAGSEFTVGDISVTPFTIPHDAVDPVGFVFASGGMRIAVATDLGYMPTNVRVALRRCDVLMVESNHDPEMLRDGPYPWSVKQRVMSRVGHLSNAALAEFLSGDYDAGAQYVVLAHLSESNNLPELARLSAEQALADRMPLFAKLVLASQDTPLAPIQI